MRDISPIASMYFYLTIMLNLPWLDTLTFLIELDNPCLIWGILLMTEYNLIACKLSIFEIM